MENTLKELRKKCVVGFVGGSDLSKQVEQLGPNGMFLSTEIEISGRFNVADPG